MAENPNPTEPSLSGTWDFRTGSPQRVFRAVLDALEGLNYEIEAPDRIELEPSPISDTATFRAELAGRKVLSQRYNLQHGAGGLISLGVGVGLVFAGLGGQIMLADWIMLAGAGVAFVFGIAALATGAQELKFVLRIKLEGEAYKATGRFMEEGSATDVIADVRVRATADLQSFAGGTPRTVAPTADDRRAMIIGFETLRDKLQGIVPSLVLREHAAMPDEREETT